MAIIFENSKEFQDNKYTIPKEVGNFLKAHEESLESQDPHFAMNGHRVVKRLSRNGENYNEKNGKKNGEKQDVATLSANDAKVIKHRMNASLNKYGTDSPKNYIYTSEVGKTIEKVCDDAIATAKRKSMQVQPVKPIKPNVADVKPATITKTKEISAPNGKISYTVTAECKKIYISESQVIKLKDK
jgi:hypothetical protein